MKILIATPTSDRYRYCIEEWLERVKNIIEYSKEHQVNYILVDNSEKDDFFKELKEKSINIIKAP